MEKQLRIVIAHASDETTDSIRDILADVHKVAEICGTVAELRRAVGVDRPDLIVAGTIFPDGDGLEALIELGEELPIPAVVVTARRSMDLVERAMKDHVMAYLIEPVTREDLHAAIVVAWSRFEQLRELEEQLGDMKQALRNRKLIERAKGMLMAERDMTEGEAFAEIRRTAQDQRVTMTEIAERLLQELAEQ